ncbi:hypothetical protein [Salsipaludibacter albus]|uniref:hypothetical protein n=1 Tax=Salsipaludibacter albus TaxID=2849650 RepID=UPI001EE48268|nr:hypothetical protein [Salsipaludibacter albus]MBY5162104.1 hypothetical protein [Salsipaludibacter albus]
MDSDREIEPVGDEVAIIEEAGVVVLKGPADLVERLAAGEVALSSARRIEPVGGAASGALAALSAALPVMQGSSQVAFQLNDAGMKMFQAGQLANSSAGGGWLRAFGHGADGISGHASIKPMAIPPQQLLSAQLAMATIALTAAIKEVQAAVERVEANVERLSDLVESQREGQITGIHDDLTMRAEAVAFNGTLSETDWHAIDDLSSAIRTQLRSLRAFARRRLAAAEDAGAGIGDRADALGHVGDLAETLALLTVAQDNLFLYQQLRLVRMRDHEPHHLDAAIAEVKALLAKESEADQDLLERVRAVVSERVTVGALEIHRVISARAVLTRATEVDGLLTWFATQRSLSYDPIEVPPLPGIGDAIGEARDRGGRAVGSARELAGGVTGRLRRREDPAPLEAGDSPEAITAGDDSDDGDSESSSGRLARLRSAAGSRLRSRGETGGEPDEDPSGGTP